MGREWAAELLLALQVLVAELLDWRLLRECSALLRSAEKNNDKTLASTSKNWLKYVETCAFWVKWLVCGG